METYNEILGIIYLQITGVGFLGNCVLLFLTAFYYHITHRTRPKSQIVISLTLSNIILLLFRGIPTFTRLWKVKCMLDNFGIKITTYIQAISRGLSMGSICLLSVFQAITISPNNSIWTQLKMRAPKCVVPCILLCWIFNLLLAMVVPIYHIGSKNNTDIKDGCNTGYRAMDVNNKNHIKAAIIACVRDVLFMSLMTCSSVYMILILYRHKRHVSHIHNNSLSIKIFPETRATLAILFLVCTFVLFNILSPFFFLHMLYFKYKSNWMIHVSAILSLWYPTVGPYILITIDNQMLKTCVH
ncbi:vomeronasal type-1 receptor 4-like [Gracilinanus agilis]|uniref:vomeronasal type-1 receptor 4-like n=1 Tax=Gracilinanus agilis TaxID=191870 RepID=UPI001CFE0897|nr:vomeronasal type-1 receptor 4-like [Gracilinanus agilis]